MNVNVNESQIIPSDLEKYLEIDFSPAGAAAQNLRERLDFDTSDEEIRLSDLCGAPLANATPGMVGWYQMFAAPKRGLALASISRLFKERSDRAHGDGFLLQSRLTMLEDAHLASKRSCYKDHADKHYVDSKKVAALETTIHEDTYKYNVMKAELGREAKVLNRPLYLTVLFFVIFGSEALLNLESFEALPWATPAIAWGATIIVGLAVGLAAHYHGTVFKQFGYWFGAAEDDNKRGPAWRMVLNGAASLTASLIFVYYARSAYFIAFVGSLQGFGQGDGNYSTLWVIGGSLLGNIIVYLVGVLWAYLLHDSNPDFAELKKSLDRDNKDADTLKRKLEQLRQRDIEQLNAVYRRKTEEAERANKQLMSQPSLAWPLELFKRFQAKDGEVAALLLNYRELLIQKLGPAAKKTNFIVCCDDPHVERRPISAGAYLQVPIKLKYSEGG